MEGTETELAARLDVGIEGQRGSQRQVDGEQGTLEGSRFWVEELSLFYFLFYSFQLYNVLILCTQIL